MFSTSSVSCLEKKNVYIFTAFNDSTFRKLLEIEFEIASGYWVLSWVTSGGWYQVNS